MGNQLRKSILDMKHTEARKFLLKKESYVNIDLPQYFDFEAVLNDAKGKLTSKKGNLLTLSDATELIKNNPKRSEMDGVNFTLFANKNGDYAWRPLTIIHPLVYVSMVNLITTKKNWNTICERFNKFESEHNIECVSIPFESRSKKSDIGETLSNWWEEFEQAQIKLALEFSYCIHTDISNCYASIYTHSIPWALHGKAWAKENRVREIGNKIDEEIRNVQYGQTNGIPQGSILMDFIAEIILGYADLLLSERIKEASIENFKILRYRDDYRIFSNSKEQAEIIIKLLSDVLSTLNLNLNSSKTFFTDEIITNAIKPDKLYWQTVYASITEKSKVKEIRSRRIKKLRIREEVSFLISPQKHLIQIKLLADKYPNSGAIQKALNEFYKLRIEKMDGRPDDLYQLISITVNIMSKNPRSIHHCIAILSKLFSEINKEEIIGILSSILRKYESKPNIGLVEIWLQRLILPFDIEIEREYETSLSKKVNSEINIWNSEWVKGGFDELHFINKETIKALNVIIPSKEVDLFYPT